MPGKLKTKKNQMKIKQILESKKITFEEVDISNDPNLKEEMRVLMGDVKALPPQIFNGSVHCGDYEAFADAVEVETLEKFLLLK